MGVFDHLYDSLRNDTNVQQSLKTGITAGTGSALAHFMWKGRPTTSLMVWIFVFLPTTMGTSLYIDYKKAKQKLMSQQYEAALKHKLLTDGTADDPRSKSS